MRKLTLLPLLFIALFFASCTKSNEALGDKYAKDGNKDEAVKYYTLAIEDGNMEALSKLVLFYRNNREKDKAKEWLLIGLEKGDEKSIKDLGAYEFSEGEYENVVKYLQPLADKGNKDVVYDLGSSLLKLKRYDEAIKVFLMGAESVYVKDPLGQAYYDSGDMINAEKYWKSAVDDHNSGAVNSHRKLLKLYEEQGRVEDYNKYKNAYE